MFAIDGGCGDPGGGGNGPHRELVGIAEVSQLFSEAVDEWATSGEHETD